MGDRGRLTATGDPSLAMTRETWTLAVLGDEQRLADLPISPTLGDQRKHLNLSPDNAKRGR